MKASSDRPTPRAGESRLTPPDTGASPDAPPACEDVDIPLLEDSLSKTPWERMLANDDALRFSESLRSAMEKRNAKP